MLDINQIPNIINEAEAAAKAAATDYLVNKLGGVDGGCCGFAWVTITEHNNKKIKGNTKIGKAMMAAGVDQNHHRQLEIWNPSSLGVQNIAVKVAGACAARDVFIKYGFSASAGSRMD